MQNQNQQQNSRGRFQTCPLVGIFRTRGQVWNLPLLFILLFYPCFAAASVITSDKNRQSFTNTDFVRGIAIGNRYVFAATTRGINQYHRDTRAWEKTLTTTNGLIENDVNVIAVDKGIECVHGMHLTDTLWCVVRGGINSYNPESGTWKRYAREDGVVGADISSIGITDNYILFESDKGMCCWYDKAASSMEFGTITVPEEISWYGKRDNTLEIMLKTGTISSLYHEHMDRTPEGLPLRYRFTCAAMDNHYLWLGTWGGGMYGYDINANEWKQQASGLKAKELALIAADGTSIWITGQSKSDSIADSGIACYTPIDNRWDYIYRSEKAGTNTIGSNWITCLLPKEDIIWFGYQGGVSRYDKSTKQWLSFTKKNALIDGNVKAIVNDKDGVWVITRWGINHFCSLSNKWKQYPYHLGLSKHGEYLTAAVVHDNTLWIAFSWLGVYRFDPRGDNWEKVILPEGFENSYVYCLVPDGDELWFGTDRGALRLNNQSWESLTKQEGLISNKVFCINKDDKYVFFGTQAGVSMYCKQTGWIRNYTMDDGLLDNDIRSIAVLRDCVYFGTPVGITVFYYRCK